MNWGNKLQQSYLLNKRELLPIQETINYVEESIPQNKDREMKRSDSDVIITPHLV
jgi:hypothetical protein